ncbi:MAG: hypothetical protein AAGF95_23740, partial [Chloroflexota bacterium]
MFTSIIHPHSSVIGLVRVFASYEDGSIAQAVNALIDKHINTRIATNTATLEQTFCCELVQGLHQLFLDYGDRDEYRHRYGADAVGWYLARCELTLLHIEHFHITFCHVGGIHAYIAHTTTLDQIVPIHNLRHELAANTIEDSCLAPFATRSNRAIANQLFSDAPEKILRTLAGLDREVFCTKLGHITTRLIGYFVDPS